MSENSIPPRALPFLVLGVGLLAISFGAILARVAQGEGLPSLVIAALRLGLAALIVTPLAWWQSRHVLRALTRRQLWLALGAGLDPRRYTIRTTPGLLAKTSAWADYFDSERPLETAIKRLG